MERQFKNKYTGVIAKSLYTNASGIYIEPETTHKPFYINPAKDKDCSWIEISNLDKEVNIASILKGIPGAYLYSPTYGNCYFVNIIKKTNEDKILIMTENHEAIILECNGHKEGVANGECIIFPSKENKDWSTFKVTERKHFEPYEKILRRTFRGDKWRASCYSYYDSKEHCHIDIAGYYIYSDFNIIPYKGNEDKVGKVTD